MKYDFTSVMDRCGKDAKAVDARHLFPQLDPDLEKKGLDVIPMWIADMNFPTVPTIPAALVERSRHPAYGYFDETDEYYDSIIRWHRERHGVETLKKENIGYHNGVIGGLMSALRVLCSRGDTILLHSPAYMGFTNSITSNGYNISYSPLLKDENGTWRMDFDDMEQRFTREKIHVMVFCSPHNPTGRVWERWELEKMVELCRKHDVYIVSDEIWSDIVLYDNKHIPVQAVNEDAKERTIALYAPSKTFNLAGLIGSYHVIYNPWLLDRVNRESDLGHYNEMNVLSMHASIAGYSDEGLEWRDELCQVLSENIDYACRFISEKFKGVTFTKPEGSYMLYIDCTQWCEENNVSYDELLRRGIYKGVLWLDGRLFKGVNCIRMNFALPRCRVEEALNRLDKYVFNA